MPITLYSPEIKCATCGEIKSGREFPRRGTNTDRVRGSCRACYNKTRSRKYLTEKSKDPVALRAKWKADRESRKRRIPNFYRNKTLMFCYGMTVREYDDLLESQGGVCLGCLKPPGEKFVLNVDHDHETGEVRGLLCRWCNLALGHAKDNADILKRLVDYLERNSNAD